MVAPDETQAQGAGGRAVVRCLSDRSEELLREAQGSRDAESADKLHMRRIHLLFVVDSVLGVGAIDNRSSFAGPCGGLGCVATSQEACLMERCFQGGGVLGVL